jgi:N-glycosylase/DNA lyase
VSLSGTVRTIVKITISTPRNFNFRRTVMSHGWYALPPFEFDNQKWTLARVIDLGSAKPVTVTICETKRGVLVNSSQVGKRAADKIIRDVRHMFRLDDDMHGFYEAVATEPEFTWIVSEGAGRLLRSPTVFEDLVKMICTTNCSWALTEKMVNSLVHELGRESHDGRKSFPTPEVMAQQSERFYRDRIRSGYRAPYLKELAQRVASGELNVESWQHARDWGSSPTNRGPQAGSPPGVVDREGSRLCPLPLGEVYTTPFKSNSDLRESRCIEIPSIRNRW